MRPIFVLCIGFYLTSFCVATASDANDNNNNNEDDDGVMVAPSQHPNGTWWAVQIQVRE